MGDTMNIEDSNQDNKQAIDDGKEDKKTADVPHTIGTDKQNVHVRRHNATHTKKARRPQQLSPEEKNVDEPQHGTPTDQNNTDESKHDGSKKKRYKIKCKNCTCENCPLKEYQKKKKESKLREIVGGGSCKCEPRCGCLDCDYVKRLQELLCNTVCGGTPETGTQQPPVVPEPGVEYAVQEPNEKSPNPQPKEQENSQSEVQPKPKPVGEKSEKCNCNSGTFNGTEGDGEQFLKRSEGTKCPETCPDKPCPPIEEAKTPEKKPPKKPDPQPKEEVNSQPEVQPKPKPVGEKSEKCQCNKGTFDGTEGDGEKFPQRSDGTKCPETCPEKPCPTEETKTPEKKPPKRPDETKTPEKKPPKRPDETKCFEPCPEKPCIEDLYKTSAKTGEGGKLNCQPGSKKKKYKIVCKNCTCEVCPLKEYESRNAEEKLDPSLIIKCDCAPICSCQKCAYIKCIGALLKKCDLVCKPKKKTKETSENYFDDTESLKLPDVITPDDSLPQAKYKDVMHDDESSEVESEPGAIDSIGLINATDPEFDKNDSEWHHPKKEKSEPIIYNVTQLIKTTEDSQLKRYSSDSTLEASPSIDCAGGNCSDSQKKFTCEDKCKSSGCNVPKETKLASSNKHTGHTSYRVASDETKFESCNAPEEESKLVSRDVPKKYIKVMYDVSKPTDIYTQFFNTGLQVASTMSCVCIDPNSCSNCQLDLLDNKTRRICNCHPFTPKSTIATKSQCEDCKFTRAEERPSEKSLTECDCIGSCKCENCKFKKTGETPSEELLTECNCIIPCKCEDCKFKKAGEKPSEEPLTECDCIGPCKCENCKFKTAGETPSEEPLTECDCIGPCKCENCKLKTAEIRPSQKPLMECDCIGTCNCTDCKFKSKPQETNDPTVLKVETFIEISNNENCEEIMNKLKNQKPCNCVGTCECDECISKVADSTLLKLGTVIEVPKCDTSKIKPTKCKCIGTCKCLDKCTFCLSKNQPDPIEMPKPEREPASTTDDPTLEKVEQLIEVPCPQPEINKEVSETDGPKMCEPDKKGICSCLDNCKCKDCKYKLQPEKNLPCKTEMCKCIIAECLSDTCPSRDKNPIEIVPIEPPQPEIKEPSAQTKCKCTDFQCLPEDFKTKYPIDDKKPETNEIDEKEKSDPEVKDPENVCEYTNSECLCKIKAESEVKIPENAVKEKVGCKCSHTGCPSQEKSEPEVKYPENEVKEKDRCKCSYTGCPSQEKLEPEVKYSENEVKEKDRCKCSHTGCPSQEKLEPEVKNPENEVNEKEGCRNNECLSQEKPKPEVEEPQKEQKCACTDFQCLPEEFKNKFPIDKDKPKKPEISKPVNEVNEPKKEQKCACTDFQCLPEDFKNKFPIDNDKPKKPEISKPVNEVNEPKKEQKCACTDFQCLPEDFKNKFPIDNDKPKKPEISKTVNEVNEPKKEQKCKCDDFQCLPEEFKNKFPTTKLKKPETIKPEKSKPGKKCLCSKFECLPEDMKAKIREKKKKRKEKLVIIPQLCKCKDFKCLPEIKSTKQIITCECTEGECLHAECSFRKKTPKPIENKEESKTPSEKIVVKPEEKPEEIEKNVCEELCGKTKESCCCRQACSCFDATPAIEWSGPCSFSPNCKCDSCKDISEAKRKFECNCKSCKCDNCPTLSKQNQIINCKCPICECCPLQKKTEEKIFDLNEQKPASNHPEIDFGTFRPCSCQPKCLCNLCPGRVQKPDNTREAKESCLCSEDCPCTVCLFRAPKKFPFDSVRSCNCRQCLCSSCPGRKD